MDESVERTIRRALDEARAKGRDHLAQTQAAVEAARQARPDMTASEILATVRLMGGIARRGESLADFRDSLPAVVNTLMWKTGQSLIKAKMKQEGAPFAGEIRLTAAGALRIERNATA